MIRENPTPNVSSAVMALMFNVCATGVILI